MFFLTLKNWITDICNTNPVQPLKRDSDREPPNLGEEEQNEEEDDDDAVWCVFISSRVFNANTVPMIITTSPFSKIFYAVALESSDSITFCTFVLPFFLINLHSLSNNGWVKLPSAKLLTFCSLHYFMYEWSKPPVVCWVQWADIFKFWRI